MLLRLQIGIHSDRWLSIMILSNWGESALENPVASMTYWQQGSLSVYTLIKYVRYLNPVPRNQYIDRHKY